MNERQMNMITENECLYRPLDIFKSDAISFIKYFSEQFFKVVVFNQRPAESFFVACKCIFNYISKLPNHHSRVFIYFLPR
jgi:hypothetical protein